MVNYGPESKSRHSRKSRASLQGKRGPDVDVTIGELTADFIKQLEDGLADGSIIAWGTFDDVPPSV